jgi:hypothetical protein
VDGLKARQLGTLTYTLTSDERLFNEAKELLAPLRAQANTLGLWDSHHLGYDGARYLLEEDSRN